MLKSRRIGCRAAVRMTLTLVVVVCILPHTTAVAGQVSVTLEQLQVPVLKLKANNPVLRIKLVVADDGPAPSVAAITISTQGTDDLADIKTVRLFYLGKDPFFVRYEDMKNSGGILDVLKDQKVSVVQVGGNQKPQASMRFAMDQPLAPGDNYFWVSYELADNANLHHKVDAGCTQIQFNDGAALEPNPTSPPVAQRIGVALRQHMDDGVDTYRIPGLATTKAGTLLAVYDARRDSRRDLQGDIDIGLSRSTDGGNTWEPMRIAMDMGEWGGLPQKFNGVSDPNILVDRNNGRVFVAALWMYGLLDADGKWIKGLTAKSTQWNHQWKAKGSQPGLDVKQTSQFMIVYSNDDGKTWSDPINLTSMCKNPQWWLLAPSPGRGITTDDGSLVFPAQGRNSDGKSFSNLVVSRDGGNTWQASAPARVGSGESSVAQLSDGSLMLNSRHGNNNFRAVAVTKDFGQTWQDHPTSDNTLPEPVCMGSLIKHVYSEGGQNKSMLVFSNPNVSEKPRRHTTIKVSFDDGMTWPQEYWLLLDEGANSGYSCLTSIDENTLGIVYEGSQSDMTFESIPLDELLHR